MISILTALREWATTLPFWEQLALNQIISGKDFTEKDYELLIQYLLEDKNLRVKSNEARPVLNFLQNNLTETSEKLCSVKLISISNLQNVNALAVNQTLTFNDKLTVIFGSNGSGKSGYARVIGSAGFTRGDREVIPNAFKSGSQNQIQEATIKLKIGEELKSINYKIGDLCSDLTSFYVFDSTSVVTHLTKSNKITFSPVGLSFLTRLSQVHDECSRRLIEQTDLLLKPHNFNELFFGDSEIKTQITGLNDKTNLKVLEKWAVLSSSEESRISDIDAEIGHLRADKISEKIKETKQTVNDLGTLIRQIKSIEQKLSSETASKFKSAIMGLREQQKIAERASVGQFQSKDFSQVGSQAWLGFLESAKKLATLEAKGDGNYPNIDHKCLLCRQNLSDEAQDLLHSFWKFLEDESQSQLESLQKSFKALKSEVAAINLDCFNDQNVSRRYLEKHHFALLETVKGFLVIAERRKQNLIDLEESSGAGEIESLPLSVINDIEKVIYALVQELVDLEQLNPQQKIFELNEELRILQHRSTLRENWAAIDGYAKNAQQAIKAQKSIGTTKHITTKHNEIFKELVTEKYIREFESLLITLNCPLKVKIKTKSQKGETLKQIVLETEDIEDIPQKIEKILSEGEKRAIALADFLTEITLNETNCSIVLDDPVTSLDWDWKETMANCLAAEALKRQVIVFTHDLHFLSLMKKYAEHNKVEIKSHWIKKEGNDEPGYVYLDNSPITEREMQKSVQATSFWQQAKGADNPVETKYFLQQGFGCLRTSYEALVVYEIFGKVVTRFEERISIDRLKEVVADTGILSEVMKKYDLVSRYVTGHLQSDAFHAQPATPEMLKKEIDSFNTLKNKIKTIRNTNLKQKNLN